MKTKQTFYRVAVNKDSQIYNHIEPCGQDLSFATDQFEKIRKESTESDVVELQENVNFQEWVTIKK